MYTIELMLKGNPAPMGLQKKEEAEAQQLFQQIVSALKTKDPQLLELSCDRTGRQLAILSAELTAVQMTPKGGPAGQAATRPGFLAQVES